jgi:hypothetical protein
MSDAGLTSAQIHRDYRDVDRIVTATNGE